MDRSISVDCSQTQKKLPSMCGAVLDYFIPRLLDIVVAMLYGSIYTAIVMMQSHLGKPFLVLFMRNFLAACCFVYWVRSKGSVFDSNCRRKPHKAKVDAGQTSTVCLGLNRISQPEILDSSENSSSTDANINASSTIDGHRGCVIATSETLPHCSNQDESRQSSPVESLAQSKYFCAIEHWGVFEWGLLAGVPLAVSLTVQSIVLTHESPNNVALWANLYVVFVPLVQGIREKYVHIFVLLGAILSLAGVYVVEGPNLQLWDGWLPVPTLYTLLSAIQAAGFTVCYLLVEEAMSRSPESFLPFTGALFLSAAVISLLWFLTNLLYVCINSGSNDALNIVTDPVAILFSGSNTESVRGFFLLFWTGIVCTAVTGVAENWSLGRIPVAEHVILIATAPVWSAICAAVFLSVPITPRVAVGNTASIMAVFIAQIPCFLERPLNEKLSVFRSCLMLNNTIKRITSSCSCCSTRDARRGPPLTNIQA